MASTNALATRWRTEAEAELADEVVARILAGRSLEGLSIGKHEGRVDLRFLPLPAMERIQRSDAQGWSVQPPEGPVTLRGVEVVGLDLTGAQLSHLRFHSSVIVDCRFDKATCSDWRLWDTSVAGCTFLWADLRTAAVGTWHDGRRNEWRQVDFTGADFRVSAAQAALFEDCNFSDADLTNVKFQQCAMVRCAFAGDLIGVVFDARELPGRAIPRPSLEADIRSARLDEVEFVNCVLDQVTLPSDPDVSLIRRYRCVLEHALALLDGDDSRPARMLRSEFQNSLRMMRGHQGDVLYNRRDYLESGVDVADLAGEVLTRGVAACGS